MYDMTPQKEHLYAIVNLGISGSFAGVSWMVEADHILHLLSTLIACISGISAATFYIRSMIHKKWK